MSDDDRDYFQKRAEQEVDFARQANHPGAVASHYRMAEIYLELSAGTIPAELGWGGAGSSHDGALPPNSIVRLVKP